MFSDHATLHAVIAKHHLDPDAVERLLQEHRMPPQWLEELLFVSETARRFDDFGAKTEFAARVAEVLSQLAKPSPTR